MVLKGLNIFHLNPAFSGNVLKKCLFYTIKIMELGPTKSIFSLSLVVINMVSFIFGGWVFHYKILTFFVAFW